jgi:hypothetical protein
MRRAIVLFILVSLAACNTTRATELPTQTADTVTEVEIPTPTTTLTPTNTPTATLTSTVAPTNTPTTTPTTSPTPDLRVINLSPKEFILTPEDLPPEGLFYLPSSRYEGPVDIMFYINGWGELKSGEFIGKTGWLDGWWVTYLRGSEGTGAPERIYNRVTMFQTASGAQASVQEYNPATTPWLDEEWDVLDVEMNLGDTNITTLRVQPLDVTKELAWYRITFSYRNYEVIVEVKDWSNFINHDYVEAAARAVLAKLEAAPIASP